MVGIARTTSAERRSASKPDEAALMEAQELRAQILAARLECRRALQKFRQALDDARKQLRKARDQRAG